MPIRAHCTICSDFFDNERDVAAIHCGHTFHHLCLLQWFDTAPSRTCPQCRIQVGKRHIINKLFFDVALEEQTGLDAESLQNELDRMKAQLAMKEKEKRDIQTIVNSLRETLDMRNATIESLQKSVTQMTMLCATLKKQMKYLEQQQDDAKSAKEEARRLRNRLKTLEGIETLLQSQRPEVEKMIHEMGTGQAAVEQLAVYCISLKKEYENLKESQKASNDTKEKLRKELFSTNHKLQKTILELEKTTEEVKSTQTDLRNADNEIMSLKKKIRVMQDTIKVSSLSNEALGWLDSESPAPVEFLSPKLHRPAHSDEIDLNDTFDVQTPNPPPNTISAPAKKLKLDKKFAHVKSLSRVLKETVESCSADTDDEHLEDLLPAFIRNSVKSKRPPASNMVAPQRNTGIVRIGYDGLGGRTKFIQPSKTTEIRPLALRCKKRSVSRQPTAATSGISQTKLDNFLK
ncbi:E3 ubiquitin-protein ligase TRAIP [Lacerta agilis]|uniref:E3 ubiquitin-protein ligase TRAIP n=1 Tax=Lacerta agilis TaxID=80427 RepID=UPI0014193155|nr:E3 ubiquitin-protein ligase TRAIP [Lacerta agilis]